MTATLYGGAEGGAVRLQDMDHPVNRDTLFAQPVPPGLELAGHLDRPFHAVSMDSTEYVVDGIICCPRAMSKRPLVMLVDDFEDAREMYRSYLAFRGLHVLCAEGGGQAIDYAREHRPDLILMDPPVPVH